MWMNHSVILYNINVISVISVYSRRHLKDIDSFINKHISEHIKDKTYRSYRLMKVPIFSCRFMYLECPEGEHISQTVHITRVEKNSLAIILLPSFGGRFSSQLGESLSWAALCRSIWLLTFCAVTWAVWISLPAGWQWTWRGSPWTLGMLTVSSAWLRSVELLQFKNMGIWLWTDLRDSMFLSLLSPPLLSLTHTFCH